jgi:hypothetical protein
MKMNMLLKPLLIVMMLSAAACTSLASGGYEEGMKKGIDMVDKASDLQSAMDAANYFERIAQTSKEWLPLYYAAYASLKAGFYDEQKPKKDEWYQKGLAFIESAKKIKEGESELLAMEGYLKLMYIANEPMKRAQEQTPAAIGLLEQAKAIDPSNPRPWFIQGQNTMFTPAFFGGGAANAKPKLEKASELFDAFTPSTPLMPAWGKPQCDRLLAKCNEAKN